MYYNPRTAILCSTPSLLLLRVLCLENILRAEGPKGAETTKALITSVARRNVVEKSPVPIGTTREAKGLKVLPMIAQVLALVHIE